MSSSRGTPRHLVFFGLSFGCAAALACSSSGGNEPAQMANTSGTSGNGNSGTGTMGQSAAANTTGAGTNIGTPAANSSSASTTAASTTNGTGDANSAGSDDTTGDSIGATETSTGAGGAAASTSGGSGGGSSTGGSGTSGGSVFPPSVTTPRIMIVGDSISAGPGCYKKYLVENLTENAITNYEFVGQYDDDCGGGVKHSAVSCTTSDQYTEPSFMVPNCFPGDEFPGMSMLVQTHEPDLIMIQLGVNDVWGGSAPIEPILDNYATLIEQARAHNPNIVVVVAQIHKIITDNCQNAASTANAEALVMAVPPWAETVSTSDSPVLVADLWTNSDAQEADDCVHPDDAGAQRMGLNWYNALADILR